MKNETTIGATGDVVDGRVRRAQQLRESRRRQLLDAGQVAFGRQGYHGTSIQQILDEAGVARATFYAHFGSKQDIFAAVLEGLLRRLAAAIRPVVVADPTPIQDQLIGNFTRILVVLEDERDLTRLLLDQANAAGPEASSHVRRFYDGAQALVVASITQGTAMGLVRPGEIPLRAAFVIGAVREGVRRALLGDDISVSRETFAQDLLTFALNGILL